MTPCLKGFGERGPNPAARIGHKCAGFAVNCAVFPRAARVSALITR
jgi:hypothetical protein